jgi:hypothetical protein
VFVPEALIPNHDKIANSAAMAPMRADHSVTPQGFLVPLDMAHPEVAVPTSRHHWLDQDYWFDHVMQGFLPCPRKLIGLGYACQHPAPCAEG